MTTGTKEFIKSLFRTMGITVGRRDRLAEMIPAHYHRSPVLPTVYRQSIGRILYFKAMLDRIRDVDGDIVECGVSIGHGILYFLLLSELIGVKRSLYGFDSFNGFPEPAVQDTTPYGSLHTRKGDYATPAEMVYRVLTDGRVSKHVMENDLTLVKGYFDKTLGQYDGTIALLHLDCDLYESYTVCLQHLYDRVAVGGLIMFDEYEDASFPGAKRAVDEFFVSKPEVLQQYSSYEYTKYYIVKAGRPSRHSTQSTRP